MSKKSRTRRIADTDEFRLIAQLQGVLPREPAWVRVGRGQDDCAVLDLGGREWLVWTCDALVEGVHFKRAWLTPRQLGRRAASINLSDLASMGAQPQAALASLHLPASYGENDYRQLMRGLGERLATFGASLVGGNLSRGRQLSIDVSLLGRTTGRAVLERRGARVGDHVLVTGFPGEAAAGLRALRSRKPPQPAPRRLIDRWRNPTPRVEAGLRLLRGGATAMVDISDGLQADLLHLCNASGVGVELDTRALPRSPSLLRFATTCGMQPRQWILAGGEDYELLCTAPARKVAGLRRRLQQDLGVPLTDIGRIVSARSGRWLLDDSGRRRLTARGHRHFGRS